jgi:hypothetical protein
MFNKTMLALSVVIVLGTASSAFANSSQYNNPDSTPNGPFFYADTYGVPLAVLRPIHQPRRPSRKH